MVSCGTCHVLGLQGTQDAKAMRPSIPPDPPSDSRHVNHTPPAAVVTADHRSRVPLLLHLNALAGAPPPGPHADACTCCASQQAWSGLWTIASSTGIDEETNQSTKRKIVAEGRRRNDSHSLGVTIGIDQHAWRAGCCALAPTHNTAQSPANKTDALKHVCYACLHAKCTLQKA